MPRKKSSKSKKRKTSKKPNASPVQDVEVTETNSISKQYPEESASAAIQDESARAVIQGENYNLEAALDQLNLNGEIYVVVDNAIEIYNSLSLPTDFEAYIPDFIPKKYNSEEALDKTKWIELPLRSESASATINPYWNDWSIRTESAFAQERSQSAEVPETLKLLPEPPLRKISSQPILQFEFTDGAKEILYTHLILKRRPYYSHLIDVCPDLADYMEYLEKVRKTNDDGIVIANSRWKENYSADWFDLIKMWNKVASDLRVFADFLDGIYEDFDDNAKISLFTYEIQGFLDQLLHIYESLAQLLERCTNCRSKYNRFCVSVKESIYLRNVAYFRRNIKNLQKQIKCELNGFGLLKNLVQYG